jgi:2'-5' RNA ligase
VSPGGKRGLAAHYDAMWREAFPAVAAGAVSCDRQVLDKASDGRRGVTLIARLSRDTSEGLGAMLAELSAIEPAQYYPPLEDLHVTVLSLFTATANWQPHMERIDEYRAAVAEALEEAGPFTIDTVGITVSTAAVLAQGFSREQVLAEIRDRLRHALTRRGLAGSLDQRYRLVTAHSTLMRFASDLQDPVLFGEALRRFRDRDFGSSEIGSLELVLNDWYMSSETLVTLGAYRLK